MSLAEALEAAAGALPAEADAIRPANGDAARLLATLSAEGASRVAGWLLAERSVEAEELAEVWCEEPAGQAALLAVDEAALPKAGRKLLRRLRHRLRSQGMAAPEAAPAPTVARLPELEEELTGAFATGFDPMGARQIWWLEPQQGGGTRLFECVIDDARGVLAFEVYSPTRSDLRRFLRSLAANTGFPAHPIEPASAKALVLGAAQQQASDAPAPKRWVEWRARLGLPAGARLPGELVAEALDAGEPAAALGAAAELVSSGRIGPWPPLHAALLPVVERVRSTLDSPLVVSGSARQEQVARLVEEAADELFSGAAGGVASHRFREAAFGFWRRAEEEPARACLAAAAAFATGSATENPVARAFVELWLRPLLKPPAEEGAPAAEDAPAAEGSLLVRP